MRRGARALGMHTEASHRFERGADVARRAPAPRPPGPPPREDRRRHRAARARRARRATSARPGRSGCAPARVSALLGVEVPRLQQVRTLESLGFLVSGSGPEATVLVPVLAPRRLARGGPRGGGGPPLRAAADRGRAAPGLPPGPAPALPAARAADPRRPDRRSASSRSSTTPSWRARRCWARPAERHAPRQPADRGAGHAAHVARGAGAPRHAADEPAARPPRRGDLRAGPRLHAARSGAPREERRLAVLLSGQHAAPTTGR